MQTSSLRPHSCCLTSCTQNDTTRAWRRTDMRTSGYAKKTWKSSRSLPLSHERVCFRPLSAWCSKNMSACNRKETSAMLLSKKIKLEVSPEDATTLEFMQGKCRGLYNWWVMRLREGERWNFAEAKRSLQESKQYDPELEWVYGKLLHDVFYRLDSAMKAFFRRVKAAETPGFPRVRPRHNFFTLRYPAMYLKVEGNTLILPTGGKGRNKHYPNIIATLTETPPGQFKEVAISRDARGNYYASFVAEHPEQSTNADNVIAFDLGIKTLATGVNEQGRVYHVGGFKGSRWYNKQLDKIRSKRDRCKKKSRR